MCHPEDPDELQTPSSSDCPTPNYHAHLSPSHFPFSPLDFVYEGQSSLHHSKFPTWQTAIFSSVQLKIELPLELGVFSYVMHQRDTLTVDIAGRWKEAVTSG